MKKKQIEIRHQHPVKILKYSSKNLWLLLLPLARGLYATQLDVNKMYEWLKGSWFDILVVIFILATGYVRWYFSNFSIDKSGISSYSGVIVRATTYIPYKNISSVTAEYKFYLRPFRAVSVSINTNAGFFGSVDMSVLMSYDDWREAQKKLNFPASSENVKYIYKPRWFETVFFSLVFSNTISGVIYVVTFLLQTNNMVIKIIEKYFTDTVNQVTAKYAKGIPPLIVGIVILIVAGWLLSFIINVLRYSGFIIRKDNNNLHIRTGVLTRRKHNIRLEKVNYVDLSQSLLTKLCSVVSLNVSCSGYGADKNEIPVFVPVMTRSQVQNTLKILLPDFSAFRSTDCESRPKPTTFFRYIWFGLVLSLIFPVAYFVISGLLKAEIKSFGLFLMIMAGIPCVMFLVAKITDFFTAGFTVSGNGLYLRYGSGFQFHNILASKEKLVRVRITQNPFQKISRTCDVTFNLCSESESGHKIRSLRYDDVIRIFSER